MSTPLPGAGTQTVYPDPPLGDNVIPDSVIPVPAIPVVPVTAVYVDPLTALQQLPPISESKAHDHEHHTPSKGVITQLITPRTTKNTDAVVPPCMQCIVPCIAIAMLTLLCIWYIVQCIAMAMPAVLRMQYIVQCITMTAALRM
jgi:hypothetical protein